MPNKNYLSGVYYERRCIASLKEQGALVAQRSAGSHSLMDVWAVLRDGSVLMVQVKTGKADTRVDAFRKLPCAKPNRKQLWYYRTRGILEVEDIP